jgi:putative ABC transport system substrate-binding protein
MGISRIALLLVAAVGAALTSDASTAQQQTKVPRVGIIIAGPGSIFDTLRQGLAQLGYVEGSTIAIEPRFHKGDLDRISDLAAELVRLDVDVIVSGGAVGGQAAQKATTKIPIVFTAVIDPVPVGLAATMERPGGNVTGITSYDPQQPRKQFELLKEMMPNLARVAILTDQDIPHAPSDPGWNPLERVNDVAARAVGLQPLMFKMKGPSPDIEGTFAAMKKAGAEALVVLEVPVVINHGKRIAESAIADRMPTMFVGGRTAANVGGLIAYGTSILDTVPLVPGYVDRILKGANPGEIPIGVITRHAVILNLKTAGAIGVTVPSELLKRADQIIE